MARWSFIEAMYAWRYDDSREITPMMNARSSTPDQGTKKADRCDIVFTAEYTNVRWTTGAQVASLHYEEALRHS